MSVESLSKEAEQKILQATEMAIDRVLNGDNPTDAVVKAATAYSLPSGHSRLVARACNVAMTNHQRESGRSLLEKTAEFSLADGDAAEERLFPATATKSATCQEVSLEYLLPPTFLREHRQQRNLAETIKSAAALLETDSKLPPLPAEFAIKAANGREAFVRQRYENARLDVAKAFEKLAESFDDLQQFFRTAKQADYVNTCHHANLIGNQSAALALSLIRKLMPNEIKQAKVTCALHSERQQQQYEMLQQIKSSSQEWFGKLTLLAERQLELPQTLPKKAAEKIVVKSLLGDEVVETIPKAASAFASGLLGGISGSTAGNIAHDVAAESPWFNADKAYTSAVDAIQDPEHEARLKNVRTQAMLHGLMLYDPVIKGHPPQSVLNAFNEISEVAPKLADQALIMQPLLRKRLSQGVLDPFEVSQLMQMDRGMSRPAQAAGGGSVL